MQIIQFERLHKLKQIFLLIQWLKDIIVVLYLTIVEFLREF